VAVLGRIMEVLLQPLEGVRLWSLQGHSQSSVNHELRQDSDGTAHTEKDLNTSQQSKNFQWAIIKNCCFFF
jgi:hypothetical protein